MLTLKRGSDTLTLDLSERNKLRRVDIVAGTSLQPRDGEISRECVRFEERSDAVYLYSLNFNPFNVTLPNGVTRTLQKGDALALPQDSILHIANRELVVQYQLRTPSIFSQSTDDEDETEEEHSYTGQTLKHP